MDIDEAPVFSTQLSIDISVVLKDKQLEAVKCFPALFFSKQSAKVAFSDLQASLKRLFLALFSFL